MNHDPQLQKIDRLLDKIRERNLLVIVEGIKDRRALNELGISKIQTLNKPLFQVVECIEDKEVVLLVDLDAQGKRLYSKLKTDLTRHGIKVDDELRKFLFRTKLVHIEGLPSYLETLRKK